MSINNQQILFPVSAIKCLRGLRSSAWDGLIDEMITLDPQDPEVAAFLLMMARQCSCATCNSDAFRMLKGCEECGKQAIQRNKSSDELLIANHAACLEKIKGHTRERTNE
jgi:hypothetical protein